MHVTRPLAALLLCGTAARAQQLERLIDRPLVLRRGAADLTLHGTYTNWSSSAVGGTNDLDGETLALGLDFGVGDRAQLGLATALPINPGAGFGSVLGSIAVALQDRAALRVDAGFESIGVNGDGSAFASHTSRYFAGFGVPLKISITPTVAFVSGRIGAIQFGHFNNIGDQGTGFYFGASGISELSSDNLVFSGGNNNSSTNIGINVPAGLLMQPDRHVAVTLLAGYSSVIVIPSGSSSTTASHFLPVGLEAVVTPVPRLDIGARFFVDGYVAQTGGSGGNLGYFDMRELMFWTRVHL
jgi:hypothetical protein